MFFSKVRILLIFSFTLVFGCIIQANDISSGDPAPVSIRNKSRVHLVDYNIENNSYFFRGPAPVVNNEFAYEDLTLLMKQDAKKKGINLPNDFYLIDFSLLSVELIEIEVEKKFFKKYKDLGEYVNYPIIGASYLDMDKPVKVIRNHILQKYKKPTILYVHCIGGCDKTGEIIGGYRMKYLANNFKEAYELNLKECGRDMHSLHKLSLRKYCEFLKQPSCES